MEFVELREGAELGQFLSTSVYCCNYSWSLLSLLFFHLHALTSGLPWPRHPGRDVIARAVFALLFLEYGIVHVNVVLHCGQILMAQ